MKTIYCNFCGKSQHEVAQVIGGPSCSICNECVWLCVEIIRGAPSAADVEYLSWFPAPMGACGSAAGAEATSSKPSATVE